MNKASLNNLLDTIYELEGLVHLAITRDDQPYKLPELILKKGQLLCRLAQEATSSEKSEPIPEPELTFQNKPQCETPPASPVHILQPVQKTASVAKEPLRGKPVFSLNDRYRFKRELFNGSDNALNATLSLVASMDTFHEAEEYFIDELQWDQSRPEVTEFLEILKKYFN